jgi:hypothetical protein
MCHEATDPALPFPFRGTSRLAKLSEAFVRASPRMRCTLSVILARPRRTVEPLSWLVSTVRWTQRVSWNLASAGAGPSRPVVPTSPDSLWLLSRLAKPDAPHALSGRSGQRMGPRHDRGGLLA